MVKVSENAIREMQEKIRFVCGELRDLSAKINAEAKKTDGWNDEQSRHFQGVMQHLSKILLFPVVELEDELKNLDKYALLTEQYHKINWRDFQKGDE